MSKKRHSPKVIATGHTSQRPRAPHRQNLAPLWIGLAILILVGAAFVLLRPQGTLPAEVQVAQAYDMYQNGALFLDVRTQQEWDQGHIERSILIPLDLLPGRMNELPRDKDIVVVCKSGARSKEGTTLLRQSGFPRVTCMNGGIEAWIAAGYPLTQ
jgi:rhodanese-related sulfurtransferase